MLVAIAIIGVLIALLWAAVQSAPFDPAIGVVPAFLRHPATETDSIAPGVRLGVWQKRSTRNPGEIVDTDSY